jgi:hypothetical protein
MMDTNAHRRHASLSFCEQDAPRGGLATVLLGMGAVWMFGIYALFMRQADFFLGPAAMLGAILLALVTCATWTANVTWDRYGRYLLWSLSGVTLSVWLIGIVSFGWLFMPLLMLEGFALLFWPRPREASIVTGTGLLCQMAGFAIVPVIVAFNVWVL